jgi:UDP-glucose 4-epimerase
LTILVTGAAGFIGSVVTEALLAEGHSVVGLDDLRYGHAEAVPAEAPLVRLDVTDASGIMALFRETRFDAVVHLAAEAYIDESISDPGRFYSVNVQGGINLLEAMKATRVTRMIFSSTAAIFGEPSEIPVTEGAERNPVNAYGDTKLAFERALSWYRRSFGINHVSFRYFNACGATELHGEDRSKETHLIPILFQVAMGKRESITLFGSDYPTPDGTCVRDYVHVADIAQAHLLGLAKVDELGAEAFNLGSGHGHTNRQVIEATREVTRHAIPVTEGPRRPGDPAVLVASFDHADKVLGWRPRHTDLKGMIASAWSWRSRHPLGYSK